MGASPKEERSAEVAEHLYLTHLHLVGATLRRIISKETSPDDLEDYYVVGRLALYHAALSYRESKGAAFRSWAINKIRYEIRQYLRDQDPLPRRMRDKLQRLHKVWERLAQSQSRLPPLPDLAREMGLGEKEVEHLLSVADPTPASLETIPEPAAGGSDENNQPFETTLARTQEAALRRAIALLKPREQFVIRHVFWEGHTAISLSEPLNVTEERATQIYAAAVAKLRQALAADEELF